MWKIPKRRFKGANAIDMDDFNETLYEYGEEAGNLGEHNFGSNPFGTSNANRIANMNADVGLSSGVATSSTSTALLQAAGWVVVTSVERATLAGIMTSAGRYMVDHFTVSPQHRGGIRIDGILDYDSITRLEAGMAVYNIYSSTFVGAGTHKIELVVQSDGDGTSGVDNATLSTMIHEN